MAYASYSRRGAGMRPRSKTLKTLIKPGVVLAGYVAAFLVADAALYLRDLRMPAEAKTSVGMYAFGDLILFVEVFGALGNCPHRAGPLFPASFPETLARVFHRMPDAGGHRPGCRGRGDLGAQSAYRRGRVASLGERRHPANARIAHTGGQLPGLRAGCANVALPLDFARGNGDGGRSTGLLVCLAAVKVEAASCRFRCIGGAPRGRHLVYTMHTYVYCLWPGVNGGLRAIFVLPYAGKDISAYFCTMRCAMLEPPGKRVCWSWMPLNVERMYSTSSRAMP